MLVNDLVNVIAEDCPPIDSGYISAKNSLVYFHRQADISKFLVGRIPRKLDIKLRICQVSRLGCGWGLELVEGLSWRKVWPVGLELVYPTFGCVIGIVCMIRGSCLYSRSRCKLPMDRLESATCTVSLQDMLCKARGVTTARLFSVSK